MAELQLSAVILAGGESKRMGRDKAWVEWAGQALLPRAVDTIRALGVREILISGRAGQDYSALGCPVLLDLKPGFGPLGGIERALQACVTPLLLVLAVDLPLMSTAFLEKLVARCDPLTGVVPERNGQLEPLAAIYPRRCHALVEDFIADARHAVCDFATACCHQGAVRYWQVAAEDAGCLVNCNHPADLSRA
jgi:molybdenum cofactor guanylyltransferase